MIAVVLDASALVALLRDEPGADRVKSIVQDSAMTAVNQSEVVAILARAGLYEIDIRTLLGPLPVTWIEFDSELAFSAGMLGPTTRGAGLSLGDRACLALAKRLAVPAMTTDRVWADIASAVGVKVDLIR